MNPRPLRPICDDGLEDPPVVTRGTIYNDSPPYEAVGTSVSAVSSGTHYRVVDGGPSVTVTCSPSASLSVSQGTVRASVVYSASVTPVTIQITGTLDPDHGDYRVLTGQQITVKLQGVVGFTVTHYAWSISPSTTVFKTYNENASSNQLVPLTSSDLTGPASGQTTVPDLNFYDRKAESLTVNCAVSLTAPDGTSLSVTAQSPAITVEKPNVTNWDISQGHVQYNPSQAIITSSGTAYGQTFGLYGDTPNANGLSAGMVWDTVTVNVPDPFIGGRCTFTQLVLPERYGYTGSTRASLDIYNGQLVLDGSFDYGSEWVLPGPPYGADEDSPAYIVGQSGGSMVHVGGYDRLSLSDAFTTWVMYKPPGGVWVPLAKFSWSWSETLNWLNGQWNLTASYPSTQGSAPEYDYQAINDPPQWSHIRS